MMFTCPTCGKYTCAHWPEYWPYRRGPTYYCSWQCLDVDQVRDMQEMNKAIALHKGVIRLNKVNQKQKDKAVQMAISGQDPRPFLKECGSKNPEKLWGYIRGCVKATNPQLFAQIPTRLNMKGAETPEAPKTAGEAMANMQAAADEFFGQCKEAGLKLDGPKEEEPEDDFECSVIRSKKTGARYELMDDYFSLKLGMDELYLPVDAWRKLLKEIRVAGHRLGVDL